jgi:hypothetical protein
MLTSTLLVRTIRFVIYHPSERVHHAILAGAAVASTLIYWSLARSFSLLALYDRPLLDLYRIAQNEPAARWHLLAAFIALGVCYWLGWRATLQVQDQTAWRIVTGGALASAACLLFLFPFGAADIFNNILHGRMLGVYGTNPFVEVARDFADDPFYAYVAWRHVPSAYGPGWEIAAAVTAGLAGDGIIANVIAFKLLPGLFLAASVVLVARILRQWAPERALPGVLLLAWNPVVLYETLGQGHNDIAMAFWIVAAVWMLTRRRYTLAILALVMGTLFKFIPALLLPAAGLIALRDLPDHRQRLRFVLVTAVASLALVYLLYAPFWQGSQVVGIGRRASLLTTSLPAVAWSLLEPRVGHDAAVKAVSTTAAVLTVLFTLWQAGRAWRNQSWLNFPQAAFNILMFYLLFTCLWFQNWYAIWPLAVAPLLPPGHAARLAALFGYAALAKPLLAAPVILWLQPLPPKLWRELWLGPVVMLLPWLYVVFAVWHERRARHEVGEVGGRR